METLIRYSLYRVFNDDRKARSALTGRRRQKIEPTCKRRRRANHGR